MKIEAERDRGSAVLRLGGRLDREWAEHLSHTLEELLRDGVRSVSIDLSRVTYVSSAATKVLTRWQQELALLRGEVYLRSVPPEVRETFAIAGWNSQLDALRASGPRAVDLRRSSWYSGGGVANSGQYQMSSGAEEGALTCRLRGQPGGMTSASFGPDACVTVDFPDNSFGLGLGAIGGSYEQCREQIGELLGVAGCVAYFPSDGARMADYLIGNGPTPPRAVLASGLTCEGAFSKLVRFNPKPEADAVPLSELAGVCLDAAGGKVAGMVIAGETAGLSGARLRRSPAVAGASPMRFDVPVVREWLSFAPERTYSVATALIAGVAARAPEGPLAAHLRPLGGIRKLYAHFHAMVFSYHPLPQRTVELGALVRGLFDNHQLRDVLHLLWDDRGEAGVGDSALVRGVGWVGPVAQVVEGRA
jgi:anti-anti-sigma factor